MFLVSLNTLIFGCLVDLANQNILVVCWRLVLNPKKGVVYLFISRYSLMGELSPPAELGIKESELGILYGYKIGDFRFSAGLARVWVRYRGSYLYTDPYPLFGTGRYYTTVYYSRVGIPLEVRYLVFLKYFGVGLTGFANYCGGRSFVGLNAFFYLGYMN